jgi:cleavage stimulation factor subunit 2
MVFDRDTHKPRGYAFCEYKDEASALSAMRNLNDRDLNGRKLRVDFADNNKINMPGDGEMDISDSTDNSGGSNRDNRPATRSNPPNLGGPPMNNARSVSPPNVTPQPRLAPQQQADAIMQILQKLPKNQLYDAVSQMKHIVMTNPEKARQIFAQNPTLAIVMLDIQFILGMIKQPFTPPPMVQPQPVLNMPMHPQPQPGIPFHHPNMPGPMSGVQLQGVPPQPVMNMPMRGPPVNMHPGMGMTPHPNMPGPMPVVAPPHVMHGAPRASPPNPYVTNQPPPSANPQQQQLQNMLKTVSQEQLQQLLSLTPQQLENLDDSMRQQVLFIQQQLRQ